MKDRFKRSSIFLFVISSILITCSIPDIFTASLDVNIVARRVKDSWIQTSIYSQPTRGELLSYDQIQELKANKNGELIELTPEIKQAVVKRLKALGVSDGEYGLLLHILNYGRVLFKVDDKGDSLSYDLQDGRKVVSWLDFGDKAIINGKSVIAKSKSDKGNDIFAYVHITKALYEQYKNNPDVLAQTVIRQYQKTFLQDYILNPDYQSKRNEFLQKIEQAKSAEDPFAELTVLLDEYDPTFDTMGVAKNTLLKAILQAYEDHPRIYNGHELLAWYRAEIEVGCLDVGKITDKINTMMQEGRIVVGGQIMRDISQASRYLFSYTPTNCGVNKDAVTYHNGNPVYLPHSNYEPEGLSEFSHRGYQVNDEAVRELYDKEFELREQIEAKSISEDEAVERMLNYILSGEFKEDVALLGILAKDIIRIRQETEEENLQRIQRGEKPITPEYGEYALHVALDGLAAVTDFLEHAIFDSYLVMAIVDKIQSTPLEDRKGPFILSAIGPQGGGKSTFCQLLRLALQEADMNVEKIAIEKNMLARGFRYVTRFPYDLIFEDDGSKETIDEDSEEMRGNGMYLWELIPAQLDAIRNGEEVYNPDSKEIVDYSKVDVLIFDGPLAQHGIDLPVLIDFTVTLTERESSQRVSRRLLRDVIHPLGKTFTESYFLNEFAAKQFHQERDIQQRDTLKPDGADVILRYGYEQDDVLFWRENVALDIARYQAKQDILEQIQSSRTLVGAELAAVESSIIDTLSSYLESLSLEDEATIISNIRSLAVDFPIFSRGWLSRAVGKLDVSKQQAIKRAVSVIIEEARENKQVVRVIPIGPAGSRGFPFSTQGEYGIPKPLNVFGGKTNLVDSITRASLDGKEIFMITTQDIIDKVRAATSGTISSDHIFDQPSNANTLACVALTLAILAEVYGEEVVVSFMTTDHDFEDLDELEEAFDNLETLASLEPALSALGIKPTEPNTNMGHIKILPRDESNPFVDDVYTASGFREKPPLDEATLLTEQGALWNSGKATGKISTWLKAYQEFAPEYYQRIQEMRAVIARVSAEKGISPLAALDELDVKSAIEEAYEYFAQNQAHYITVLNAPVPEYSLSLGLGMVPYLSRWSDLGSLRGRWTNEEIDSNGNVIRVVDPGNVTLENVSGSNIILASDDATTRIHVAGLEKVVVAYNDDNKTLVVVPILYDGNVKNIVNGLIADPLLQRFVFINNPAIELTPRVGISEEQFGTNTSYLADGGDVLTIESENVRVFAQGGLVCGTNLSGVTIIKIGNEIYVYGSGYQADADAKLREVLGR